MLCFAHRGARGYAPENTFSAIELALEQRADWIEIDVRSVAGQLLVIHDDRLETTTDGHGYLWQHSIDQLRQLDAGEGQCIPYLSEVIELVDRRAGVNIELKDTASVTAVVDLIEEYIDRGWDYTDFLVSSFFHHEVKKIKQHNPKIRTGALLTGIPQDYAAFGEQLNAWSVNFNRECLNQTVIDDAHRRGLKVLVFTVNLAEEIDQLANMGVDGIFTDYPDLLTGTHPIKETSEEHYQPSLPLE